MNQLAQYTGDPWPSSRSGHKIGLEWWYNDNDLGHRRGSLRQLPLTSHLHCETPDGCQGAASAMQQQLPYVLHNANLLPLHTVWSPVKELVCYVNQAIAVNISLFGHVIDSSDIANGVYMIVIYVIPYQVVCNCNFLIFKIQCFGLPFFLCIWHAIILKEKLKLGTGRGTVILIFLLCIE